MSFYRIRPRSGTASQWNLVNPVLGEREIGFEVPDGGVGSGEVKMKMGDGTTAWTDLPYAIIAGISPDDIVHNGETNDSTKIVGADAFYALTRNVTELTNSLSIKTLLSQSKDLITITHESVTLKHMRADISNGMCTLYGVLSIPTNMALASLQLGTLIDELIPITPKIVTFTAWAGRSSGTMSFSTTGTVTIAMANAINLSNADAVDAHFETTYRLKNV